jgi:hypothetical protein
MSDKVYRDAGTGEFVTEEYAEANPGTTVSETIDYSQQDQEDLAQLFEMPSGETNAPAFHPILEVWREVLKPAAAEGQKKVTPQWANKMVQSYPELKFADCNALRDTYYEKLQTMFEIVVAEIDEDEECLNAATPEEDREENGKHYKNILLHWQLRFLGWELQWDCTDGDAAIELAAISETHKIFFGDTGLTQFLDNIKFEFTEDDALEIAAQLEELRVQYLGGDSE